MAVESSRTSENRPVAVGSHVADTVPPDGPTEPERIEAVVLADADRKPARLLPAASGRLPPDATDTRPPGWVVTLKPVPRSSAVATASTPPLPTVTLPVPSARATPASTVPDEMVVPPVKFPEPLSCRVPEPVLTSEPAPVRPVGIVNTAAGSVTAISPLPLSVNKPAREAVAPS